MQIPAVRIITAAAAVLISATMLQTNARADAGNEPTPAASTQAADAAAAKTVEPSKATETAKPSEAATTEEAAETPKQATQQSKAADPTESTTAAEPTESATPDASETATPGDTATPSPTSTATANARIGARVGLAAAPDAAECTPQDRSSSITSLSISGADDLREWQQVTANFSGSLPLGGCAGDTVTITVPPQLSAHPGSFPVLDPDGVSMGTMVVSSDGVATITFNDYVETHTNVTFHGYLAAQVGNQMLPGQSYDLSWKVGTTVVTTPVTMQECPNCDVPHTWPGKWANFNPGDPGSVTFALVSAVTQASGETVVFTDTLGAGQHLDCSSLVVTEADSVDAWGDLQFDSSWTADTAACDEATGTLTVQVTSNKAGQYFRVLGSATVTETRSSYTDEGTVTQRGVTKPVQAAAIVYSGGAGGDGETPTPTPTPSETPTPTPTETTPASNPAPSETSTTSTPSTTTTTKTPTTPTTSLPQTGSDASALGAGVGLLLVVMGSGALLAARRRR